MLSGDHLTVYLGVFLLDLGIGRDVVRGDHGLASEVERVDVLSTCLLLTGTLASSQLTLESLSKRQSGLRADHKSEPGRYAYNWQTYQTALQSSDHRLPSRFRVLCTLDRTHGPSDSTIIAFNLPAAAMTRS